MTSFVISTDEHLYRLTKHLDLDMKNDLFIYLSLGVIQRFRCCCRENAWSCTWHKQTWRKWTWRVLTSPFPSSLLPLAHSVNVIAVSVHMDIGICNHAPMR